MNFPLDQYLADVARYSDLLLRDVDPEGTIRDMKGFQASAMSMGASGNTEPVLMTWAEILACTHADGETPVRRFVDAIPDEQWHEPTRRHARALIDTARSVIGATDHFELLTEQMYRATDTLGNDIWWLILTMAQATGSVVHTLGGAAGMSEVSRIVEAGGRRQPGPQRALGPAVAALSAIAAGSADAAADYLALCETHDMLGVLLPLADTVLLGDVSVVVGLDPDGTADILTTPADSPEPGTALVWGLLEAVRSGDADRVSEAVGAIGSADENDLAQMVRQLALSIGHRIGHDRALSS